MFGQRWNHSLMRQRAKGTGTLVYAAFLWARLWKGFLINIITTTVSRHGTDHHFVKKKTKTGGRLSDMFKVPQVTVSQVKQNQDSTSGSTRICVWGKPSSMSLRAPSCIFFYKYVISKILRRKSWLQFGTISFTCNKAPVSAGTPTQKQVSVLINVLPVVVEGEDSYQLQESLRGFYYVIWKAHSRTYT